ncbi:MAG: diguanylate cyclase [Pseudolabrys sp.]
MASVSVASSTFSIPTLLLVGMAIAALLGVFLLLTWLQDRAMRALAWWSAAYLIGGAAMALWNVPDDWLIPSWAPGALLYLACGIVVNGVRVFHHRPVRYLGAYFVTVVWFGVKQLPGLEDGTSPRLITGAVIVAAYTFLIMFELRHDRRKAGRMAGPRFLVPITHAAIFLLPVALNEMFPGPLHEVFARTWFQLFAIETILYAVGTAFIVLLLVKDHHVQIHKTAASTDPLTGLFNRRGFYEAAAQLRARAAKKHEPVSVLMFDLDHFKSVNDRFGHATGDDVIHRFARTAADSMRAEDIVARLGGEEFAAIVAGGEDVAALIGERVRGNFQVAGTHFNDIAINATVSVGAACSREPTLDLHVLLDRADAALYQAKKGGRNRVTVAAEPEPHPVARHIAAARAAKLPVVRSPSLVPAAGNPLAAQSARV